MRTPGGRLDSGRDGTEKPDLVLVGRAPIGGGGRLCRSETIGNCRLINSAGLGDQKGLKPDLSNYFEEIFE